MKDSIRPFGGYDNHDTILCTVLSRADKINSSCLGTAMILLWSLFTPPSTPTLERLLQPVVYLILLIPRSLCCLSLRLDPFLLSLAELDLFGLL